MQKITFTLKILFLFFILGLISCSTIVEGMYGMKKTKPIDEKSITDYSKKYNIPSADSYEIDTSYLTFLYSLDTALYEKQTHNHYQPLQALYYDKTGNLQSFQINCNAGGFPNLKWDRNEIMTTFPPKQQTLLDSILPFKIQLKYLRPLSQTQSFLAGSYDYIVVVYWSKFMGRQSKRLIHFVQENCKLATDKNVKIIYANSDNIFVGQ